ncbi:MAG: HD domain-containing protein, partial [Marinobacter sp.]|nr:HD domain-containing protein [Marinobacter sp.]
HTMQVIRNMVRLGSPEATTDYPLASKLINGLPKLESLYIAGLYHDVAKGRGGDHSELGAIDAAEFCQRHHLSERDTQLV